LQAEAARTWGLHQAGILRELYFTADAHEAVLILEFGSAEEVQSHPAGLPPFSHLLSSAD